MCVHVKREGGRNFFLRDIKTLLEAGDKNDIISNELASGENKRKQLKKLP